MPSPTEQKSPGWVEDLVAADCLVVHEQREHTLGADLRESPLRPVAVNSAVMTCLPGVTGPSD
jgi:hypothetical protein